MRHHWLNELAVSQVVAVKSWRCLAKCERADTLAAIDASADDPQLVHDALAGDRRALDQLLRRQYPAIHGLCRRMTGNDADAVDAAQDALIAVVRGLHRFDGRSRFSTWVYRVTVNTCLDELRRRRRRPEPRDIDALARTTPASSAPVDSAVAERLDVDAALRALPPDFRAAVVLRDLCGLDYAEISEVLAVPAGTVRSRIARGRAALADRLGNPSRPADRPTSRP